MKHSRCWLGILLGFCTCVGSVPDRTLAVGNSVGCTADIRCDAPAAHISTTTPITSTFGLAMQDDITVLGAEVWRLNPSTATWEIEATLPGPGALHLGQSAAIDGNRIVLGAPWTDSGQYLSGAAFVYRFDAVSSIWLLEQELVPPTGSDTNGLFGVAVGIDQDVIVVGALSSGTGDTVRGGAAFVFRFDLKSSSWIFDQHLDSPLIRQGDNFGQTLGIEGEDIVVGAFGATAGGEFAGRVHIFRYDDVTATWREKQRLIDGGTYERYGYSLSLESGILVIGRRGVDTTSGMRMVDVYKKDFAFQLWARVAQISRGNSFPFGQRVATTGTRIIVGSNEEAALAFRTPDAGLTWEFQRTLSLDRSTVIASPDIYVAIAGNQAVFLRQSDDLFAGFPLQDEDCNCNGLGDVCELAQNDCDGNELPDDCDLLDGAADCQTNGILDVCEQDCDQSGTPDDCDIANGTPDRNQNGIPDDCEDCNENGVFDLDDIDFNTSRDCNKNEIPDACEIRPKTSSLLGTFFCAGPCSSDCNDNGVPDECDLAEGDCNQDGVPDDCAVVINCDAGPPETLVHPGSSRAAFGARMAGSDRFVAIRSKFSDPNDVAGAVHLYEYMEPAQRWHFLQTISPPDVEGNHTFGDSLYLDGNRLIIGMPQDSAILSRQGSATVLEFDESTSTWNEKATLRPGDELGSMAFGEAVAISGNLALVGAPGRQTGVTFVFRYDETLQEWVEFQKLFLESRRANDSFGRATAITGSSLFVGAVNFNVAELKREIAIYVFDFSAETNQWQQSDRLVPELAATNFDTRSMSISVAEGVLAVGIHQDNTHTSSTGSASFFRRNPQSGSWTFEYQAQPMDLQSGDWFGYSIDTDGHYVVVGAPLADLPTSNAGAAYLFHYSEEEQSWKQASKLHRADEMDGTWGLGWAASLASNSVVLGSPSWDESLGKVSSYRFRDFDCNCNGMPDACDIESGLPDCNTNSIPDECEPDCDNDGTPNACEIDCNQNGWPDQCELDEGTSDDCNGNGVLDECDLEDASSLDCNFNGIPDECEPSCLGNGSPDECNIASGLAADCNGNGVPDSCDLRDGTSVDSDSDGLIDECDSFFPIPTVSEWGLAILAILLMTLGKLTFGEHAKRI
jgi:FG-GAP repeat/IPTL-CTERM motif